jgi:hypothetical protein
MAQGLFYAHSGWRFLVILVAAIVGVRILVGLKAGIWHEKRDKLLALSYPVMLDIQVLLGIGLWLGRELYRAGLPLHRFEHPFTMILAMIVAHAGFKLCKEKEEATEKFKTLLTCYGISIVLLALGIWRVTSIKG